MKPPYRLLALMVMIYAGIVSSAHATIEYADITGGRVKGEVSDGLATFKGIPFAAPPVGALRWRVPQPVVPWHGIRVAYAFTPACVQPRDEPNPTREDCLYLNVWTAAASAKERLPVMVCIHGGGLKWGMSWQTLSYGHHLAREGVVLVTIAYRLGAMGFFAHPELTLESGGKGSGNYGIYDVIAALQWVQANIAQFGGDPTRVTLFGGSASGLAVSLLTGAPAARGLFARANALMRKYWINFATRGDPNGPGLPVWQRFDERSQAAMVFDERPGSRRLPNLAGLRALDGVLRCGD